MKKIGILTSGGDAPGMNAAIRAVVRTGIYLGMDVVGIERGYEGLLDGSFRKMDLSSVGDIMQRGGTILKTARSQRFMTSEGQQLAVQNLKQNDIDGIVVCGGDGSFRGALELEKQGFGVMGIPCTIDNDMGYTDFTIGFDTAVNTVLSAISNLRDTASSHDRTSIIEVMGRNCGDIALYSGVTGGAECILIPEQPVDLDAVCEKVRASVRREKSHSIIVKAEGVPIPTEELAEQVAKRTGEEVRTVVLAYIQRGGSPTAKDRMMASQMGNRAVELMHDDESGKAIGLDGNRIRETTLSVAATLPREADLELLSLADMLSI